MQLEEFNNCSKAELFNWFKALVDSAYNGITAIDQDGRVIIVNESSERLMGIKREDVLGHKIEDVIPESKLMSTLKSGDNQTAQYLEINGRKLYSNRTPMVYQGEIIGAIAVFQDITGIKEVKERLEETEHNLSVLEATLNSAYEGIIIVDSAGKITKLNKAYQDFLGIDEQDVLGKHVTDVIENTRMHIVIKTGKKEIGRVQRIQGNDMVASRIPVRKDGEIIGAVGKVLFQDVQELKSLADRIESLENKLDYYKNEIKSMQQAKYSFESIITRNEAMKELKSLAMRAADSSSTVLIQGESGTGKELFAHAIHKTSNRKYGAFIRVNCAAIPENLLESELFGYEKGSFTGAKDEGKPGKFELANGGTIFLDEIGEMPLEMQVKILRVLQEREVERIGSAKTIQLDVRVIAATNRNLEKMVDSNSFRRDLYYRLNVIRLDIPPLRDRINDIPILAKSILAELKKELNLEDKKLSKQAIGALMGYDWPGNVRELRNFIERAINLTADELILAKHFPEEISSQAEEYDDANGEIWDLKEAVAKTEKKIIKQVLEETDNNKTEAADLMGIHRTSLYKKLDRYSI